MAIPSRLILLPQPSRGAFQHRLGPDTVEEQLGAGSVGGFRSVSFLFGQSVQEDGHLTAAPFEGLSLVAFVRHVMVQQGQQKIAKPAVLMLEVVQLIGLEKVALVSASAAILFPFVAVLVQRRLLARGEH